MSFDHLGVHRHALALGYSVPGLAIHFHLRLGLSLEELVFDSFLDMFDVFEG
jgi:hypothetical protein